jgi:hypothetical protein
MRVIVDNNGDKWFCTDPNNLQYSRLINEHSWEFKEFNRHQFQDEFEDASDLFFDGKLEDRVKLFNTPNYWIQLEVDLKNYSNEEMWGHCSSYYDREEFKSLLESDPEIIAECIFEQESELY